MELARLAYSPAKRDSLGHVIGWSLAELYLSCGRASRTERHAVRSVAFTFFTPDTWYGKIKPQSQRVKSIQDVCTHHDIIGRLNSQLEPRKSSNIVQEFTMELVSRTKYDELSEGLCRTMKVDQGRTNSLYYSCQLI
jgi:hypothetical protein